MKFQQNAIVEAWNNRMNTDVGQVAQQIANRYRHYINEEDSQMTTWALIIKKDYYYFE